MWVYIAHNEGQGHYLYTVGFYSPRGDWHPDSDWGTREEAARRINYLNGGTGAPITAA